VAAALSQAKAAIQLQFSPVSDSRSFSIRIRAAAIMREEFPQVSFGNYSAIVSRGADLSRE
jgi:hypothetical protein